MTLDVLLVVLLVLTAMATVMTARLLRSVIGLAATSAVLAVILFRLQSPMAAVFELSVCAGLIPAVFLSAISMTARLSPEGLALRQREKLKQYWALPVLLLLATAVVTQVQLPALPALPAVASAEDVRTVLWNVRQLDLLGQIVVLLGGAFGVVVLVKEYKRES